MFSGTLFLITFCAAAIGLALALFRLRHQLDTLSERVQTRLDTGLKTGIEQYERVREHLQRAENEMRELGRIGQSIHDLNSILKMPHLRGSFGEDTLERLLCDLLPADLYELQYCITPGSQERVDAVIKYPDRVLPIDSKFPREQILALFESQNPDEISQARQALRDFMRSSARKIHDKYIRPEEGTTDMALLFLPSETIYFEVLRDVRLREDLTKLKVFTVSPNTLAVTLQAFVAARKYYDLAKGVEKAVEQVQRAEAHLTRFSNRFDEIGLALTRAQQAFMTATTHFSRYQTSISHLGVKEQAANAKSTLVENRDV